MSLWSSTALMVWEIVVTVDQEIEIVWTGKWTLPKSLYVTARYLALATSILSSISSSQDHLNTFCDAYNVSFQILYCIISAASDGLLVLRVCAMYGSAGSIVSRGFSVQHTVLALYAALLLIYVAISIWDIQASVNFEPGVDNFGCFVITGLPLWPPTLVVIATLVFDALLFFLTVWKILTDWKKGYGGALTNLLLRDGAIYFGQIFVTSLVCTVFLQAAPPIVVQSAALPWYAVLTPISAGRLFLNLKSMGTAKEAMSGISTGPDLPERDRHWERHRAPSTTLTTIHMPTDNVGV